MCVCFLLWCVLDGYLSHKYSLVVIKLCSQWLDVSGSLSHVGGLDSNPYDLVEHHGEVCIV